MTKILQEIEMGLLPSMPELVDELSPKLPLLLELENTPQDAEWHAEGNVLIHTEMVLQEAYSLCQGEAASQSLENKCSLKLAALFHDIAKPICTREKEIDGRTRIVSPRHEEVGRSYLATRLPALLGYAQAEATMSLTGYHNALKLLVVRNNAQGDYFKLARLVDLKLLYWLERADIQGRDCKDKDKQLEILELFALFCNDYGLWEGHEQSEWNQELEALTKNFSESTCDLIRAKSNRDYEAGTIHSVSEALSRSYGYRDNFPELVITVGMSGSGKSQWISNQLPEHQLISMDEIRESLTSRSDQRDNSRIFRIAKEELRKALRAKKKIVWDATSLRRDFRTPLIELAEAYGALVTIAAFFCPPELIRKRNKERKHPIPLHALSTQQEKMQWPDKNEGHRYLVIDHLGKLLWHQGFSSPAPYNMELSDAR